MNANELLAYISSPNTQNRFAALYGSDKNTLALQTQRYNSLVEAFCKRYGDGNIRLFSSPGRSEIGGNHTDHNLGKVLAASIQLDCIGAVEQTGDGIITICDLTYNEDYSIDTNQTVRIEGEKGSIALVRGMIEGFKRAGFKVGGFKGMFTSSVIAAAGVSSSASFEMMICLILNQLYNDGKISVCQMATAGQFAEQKYWDKGSGLLDQMACASGGLVTIDFENPTSPASEKLDFDFSKENYNLILVNTGKGHADLSAEYSAVPSEMKAVAKLCGKETLRGITFDSIIEKMPQIRSACGDRAVMRAFHFLAENEKVDAEVAALKNNDFKKFLSLITDSGNSSWKWLQNVYVADNAQEQPIPVCLGLTELFIARNCPATSAKPGACRIHGGGFAGVMMALLPQELTESYKEYMHKALGVKAGDKDPVYVMSIRPEGSIEITA